MFPYLTTIPNHEPLLERFLTALETNKGYTVSPAYPYPLVLDTGESFLLDTVVRYYLDTRPLDLADHTAFLERLRLAPGPDTGFQRYKHTLDLWAAGVVRSAVYGLARTK